MQLKKYTKIQQSRILSEIKAIILSKGSYKLKTKKKALKHLISAISVNSKTKSGCISALVDICIQDEYFFLYQLSSITEEAKTKLNKLAKQSMCLNEYVGDMAALKN